MIKEICYRSLLVVISFFLAVFIILSVDIFYHSSMTKAHFHDPNTRFDPDLGWSVIKERSTVDMHNNIISSNEDGYRSPEIDPERDHILVLGDSVAFGLGVGDNETMTSYLDDMVDEQVLNLAVSGYGLDQYYMQLSKEIHKTNPKHVLVVLCTGNSRIQYLRCHYRLTL